jgi:hypothetical protein
MRDKKNEVDYNNLFFPRKTYITESGVAEVSNTTHCGFIMPHAYMADQIPYYSSSNKHGYYFMINSEENLKKQN